MFPQCSTIKQESIPDIQQPMSLYSLKQNDVKNEELVKSECTNYFTQSKIIDQFKARKRTKSEDKKDVKKRRLNRFNGISEEELGKRGLPDLIKENLDILFIGINPSLTAAFTGKYYSGPGNHFWKALYLSGLIPEPMNPSDDFKLLDLGIGFTDIVARPTRSMADLSKQEIVDGSKILMEKLLNYRPKIAVFNGKAIYQIYSGQKRFLFGKQPIPVNNGTTWIWVMPSSSARCAQLPRAVDKVPFFSALKKFKEILNGEISNVDDSELTFPSVVLKNKPKLENLPSQSKFESK